MFVSGDPLQIVVAAAALLAAFLLGYAVRLHGRGARSIYFGIGEFGIAQVEIAGAASPFDERYQLRTRIHDIARGIARPRIGHELQGAIGAVFMVRKLARWIDPEA